MKSFGGLGRIVPGHFDRDLVKIPEINSGSDSEIEQTILACFDRNVNFPLYSFAVFTDGFDGASFESSFAIIRLMTFFSTFATDGRFFAVYF